MMSLQDRLSASTADAHQARQSTGALEQKVHALEVEKTLAANVEQRLNTAISKVTSPAWLAENSFCKPCMLAVAI